MIEASKDGMPSGDPSDYLESGVVRGLVSGEEAARAAAAVPGLTDADFGSGFLGARRTFQEGDAFVLTKQWAPLLEEAWQAHERLC